MTYNTPTLALVGAAQNLVLQLSETAKPTPDTACINQDVAGIRYVVDEVGW